MRDWKKWQIQWASVSYRRADMEMCYIVTVICVTLVVLAYIGNKKDKK